MYILIQYQHLTVNFTDTDTNTDNGRVIHASSELAMGDCSIKKSVLLEYLNLYYEHSIY